MVDVRASALLLLGRIAAGDSKRVSTGSGEGVKENVVGDFRVGGFKVGGIEDGRQTFIPVRPFVVVENPPWGSTTCLNRGNWNSCMNRKVVATNVLSN